MAFKVQKSIRQDILPQVVLMGGPGSGKTYGSLRLATGFGCKHIVLIDTENKRSRYYADEFDFEAIYMRAPYSTERYQGAISDAVERGADCLIVDQVTYEWSGEGGVLDSVDNSPVANDFVKWKEPRKIHNGLLDTFVELSIPYILCARAKVEWAMEQNDRGKMVPVVKGYEAVQGGRGPREKFEFEFPLVFLVKPDHKDIAMKDMTHLFTNKVAVEDGEDVFEYREEILTEAIGKEIMEWAKGGKPPKAKKVK